MTSIVHFYLWTYLHWARVKCVKSPTLAVLTATTRGSPPAVAWLARAPGRVGHGPPSRAPAPVHMRRAQPSADRVFRDCAKSQAPSATAFSIGEAPGSAAGLDRVAHIMASTIVSTVTCAHQHDEDDKGHRRAAKNGKCANWELYARDGEATRGRVKRFQSGRMGRKGAQNVYLRFSAPGG